MLHKLRILTGVSTVAAATAATLIAIPVLAKTANSSFATELPEVSAAIPQTDASHAFLGAKERMEASGYIEEEYFLSGRANVYDWVGTSRDVHVVAGPTRYVTRILVRRPKDPANFSGNVEVNVLNATLAVDRGGPSDLKRMIADGDAWIGITSKALTAKALKRFDPVRYAPLNWANPRQPEQYCRKPSIIPLYTMGGEAGFDAMTKMGLSASTPDNEDGLVWDMLGQLGLLLKSDTGRQILPRLGDAPPRLFMTGISQSSLLIRTWMTGFHHLYRTTDGKPVYDGYLSIVGPNMLRLNQCSEDVQLDDPRQKLLPPDVPFIALSSEGENWLTSHTWQPDIFTKSGGLVTYEIAGSMHRRIDVPGLEADPLAKASNTDDTKAGFTPVESPVFDKLVASGFDMNDLPWAPILRGAFHNLQEWAIQGIRPPQAKPIKLDKDLQILRDPQGNAIGGVRTPYVDVPLASYRGAVSAGGPGAIFGIKKQWSAQQAAAAYPNPDTYFVSFEKASANMVKERWISKPDADAMNEDALQRWGSLTQ